MNNKFDELTKSMAQSVTRRAALKKFGVGLAGMALACFGLVNQAKAVGNRCCSTDADCGRNQWCVYGGCCESGVGPCCCDNGKTRLPKCSPHYSSCVSACRVPIKW